MQILKRTEKKISNSNSDKVQKNVLYSIARLNKKKVTTQICMEHKKI